MKRWSALYGYRVLISHGVTMRSAAQTDAYPRASARRAASARTALAALPEIGRKTPNFNARPALEMSASAHSIRGGPRDDHLPAIPPLDQEDAVADLARGHLLQSPRYALGLLRKLLIEGKPRSPRTALATGRNPSAASRARSRDAERAGRSLRRVEPGQRDAGRRAGRADSR